MREKYTSERLKKREELVDKDIVNELKAEITQSTFPRVAIADVYMSIELERLRKDSNQIL